MSQVFHGVVVRSSEPEVRALFAALDSRVPLRLVQLDEGVFGVYAQRRGDGSGDLQRISKQLARIPGELQRIAAELSRTTRSALFYWYDSRVGDWYQLFEHGEMTRELVADEHPRDTWDPLEAIGARRSLHEVVESAFLYDTLDPLAESRPVYTSKGHSPYQQSS